MGSIEKHILKSFIFTHPKWMDGSRHELWIVSFGRLLDFDDLGEVLFSPWCFFMQNIVSTSLVRVVGNLSVGSPLFFYIFFFGKGFMICVFFTQIIQEKTYQQLPEVTPF